MTPSASKTPETAPDNPHKTLPRRDWVILPLLCLLTVGLMFFATEETSRHIWVEGGADSCRERDPIIAQRIKPNCTFRMKAAEGPWVEYKFNSCGYRSEAPCGPKSPGTMRIALLGSSTSEGYMIPYEQTVSALVGKGLGSFCNPRVEVQNMGTMGCYPIYAYRRVDEALTLNPDAVLFAITPFDIQQDIDPALLASRKSPVPIVSKPSKKVEKMTSAERLEEVLSRSTTMFTAKHFLYQDPQTYVRLYLLQGDQAGFLRQPFTPAWEKRFSDLDLLLGEMADKVRAAGIPFILTAFPEHAQAAMFGLKDLPRGVDPFAFDMKVAQIAAKHGIVYVDLFNDFKREGHPEKLFYPADGHLAPGGQALIARTLVRHLSRIPNLIECDIPKPEN